MGHPSRTNKGLRRRDERRRSAIERFEAQLRTVQTYPRRYLEGTEARIERDIENTRRNLGR
jgi:hypothetical protein